MQEPTPTVGCALLNTPFNRHFGGKKNFALGSDFYSKNDDYAIKGAEKGSLEARKPRLARVPGLIAIGISVAIKGE